MSTDVLERPVEVAVEATTEPDLKSHIQPRRRDPFDLMNQLQTEFDRFWGERRFPFRAMPKLGIFDESWVPRANVYEQNGNLVVKTELPGMKKEDFHVDVEHGDRKTEEKDFYRSERSFGSFCWRLPMPEAVAVDEVKATYKDGVLEVVLPKPVAKAIDAKQVEVKEDPLSTMRLEKSPD